MYNYSHSKRILPRKDEPYRTEIPQFYSTSSPSLYSYTPTSSSDCPEHGRSHRRATIILTFCVAFGTIGVLSIAGVAAYLGMISRSLHNASQVEESFLLSKSNYGEDLTTVNNINSHLSNNNNNHLIIDEEDAHEVTTTSTSTIRRTSTKAPSSYDPNLLVTAGAGIKNQYNQNGGRRRVDIGNHRHHLQHYEDESIAVDNSHNQNSHNSNDEQIDLTNSLNAEPTFPSSPSRPVNSNFETKRPIITRPPLNADSDQISLAGNGNIRKPTSQPNPETIEGTVNKIVTVVTSSTSQQQSHSSVAEEPPLRLLTTNNPPPSLNHFSPNLASDGINLSELNNRPLSKFPVLPSLEATVPIDSQQFQYSTRVRSEILHHHSGNVSGLRPISPVATVIPTTTMKYLNNQFANRQGQLTFAVELADDRNFLPIPIPVTSTTIKPKSKPSVQSFSHQNHQQHSESHGFIPSKPIVMPARREETAHEEEDNGEKTHLTFDRISPEFYDQQPWTPLIVRPSNHPIQLDKKPRIEIPSPTSTDPILDDPTSNSPTTFVSINADSSTSIFPQSKEMYYNYNDKQPNVFINKEEHQDSKDDVNLHEDNNNNNEENNSHNEHDNNGRVGQIHTDESHREDDKAESIRHGDLVPSSTSSSQSPITSDDQSNTGSISDNSSNKDAIVSSSSTGDDELRDDDRDVISSEHSPSIQDDNKSNMDNTKTSAENEPNVMTTLTSVSNQMEQDEEIEGFTSPAVESNPEIDEDIIRRPIQIPAYTVLIPHIPNPKPDKEVNDETNLENGTENYKPEQQLDSMQSDEEQPDNVTTVGQREDGGQDESVAEVLKVAPEEQNLSSAESLHKDKAEPLDVASHEVHYSHEDTDEYDNNDQVYDEGESHNEPQNIYKLDVPQTPLIVDIIPQRERPLSKLSNQTKVGSKSEIQQHLQQSTHSPQEEALPQKQKTSKKDDIQSTTDYILSALGNLSLVKTMSTADSDLPSSTTSHRDGTKLDPEPLFPPIRSYVGINQPLRPKPSELDEAEDDANQHEKIILLTDSNFLVGQDGGPLLKKVKISTSDEDEGNSATAALNKVLSMMMKVELPEPTSASSDSADKAKNYGEPIAHNVHLLLAGSTTNAGSPNNSREQKSIYRDPKIDPRFHDEIEQIPVPLIIAAAATSYDNDQPTRQIRISSKANSTRSKWNPIKPSSITVNENSPVYKFVLRRGQSVEDLLKEIFQNFTDKGIGQTLNKTGGGTFASANIIKPDAGGIVNLQFSSDSKPISSKDKQKTTPSSRDDFEDETEPPPTLISTSTTRELSGESTTTLNPSLHTSTSITVNEIEDNCPSNSSFRCLSNGECISNFARCNGIRECKDGSDEKHCTCVEYLKAQMLHRKICDGFPDCKDLTDEYDQCEWCKPGQYICSGSRVCIPRDKICDSRRDCPRGDDESDCVKIGRSGDSGQVDEMEDLAPTYHRSGHLMVRKKGVWGKLCVETFSTVLSHWEIKDLARAVCKAKTFTDFESVERVEDDDFNGDEPYYELYDGSNDTDSASAYSSSESTPRTTIGFKVSPCKSRLVVKVTCQDLQCGTAPRTFTQAARIVGGSNAFPGEWPWQAALYRDGEYQCGATLISSRWLLSAGHCFYHAQDDYWVARLGTLRRGAAVLSPYEQVIRITHVFLHPQYKDVGFVNDVSLLRLEHEVNFTDFVRPVCMPNKDTSIRDGRMCTVVGWGQLYEVGRVFPDTLQEVQLPLISTTECRKRTLFLPLYKLTDQMFCAGFDRGGRDACLGDSGGPLMCSEGDGKWSLYGVTSNGWGCARAYRPGVYTKVASYLDWIYEKMSQDDTFAYRDKAKLCPGYRCQLGECIDEKRICNGFSDCDSGEDERNCTWS